VLLLQVRSAMLLCPDSYRSRGVRPLIERRRTDKKEEQVRDSVPKGPMIVCQHISLYFRNVPGRKKKNRAA
jgi:hypothetical protein